MGKWPKLAYYWPTDDLISASDAIKKRERDNRTGVIWCHAECYKTNPQNGNALFARRGPGSPHFWLGTGNFTKYVGCDFEVFKSRNSESNRYSQVLHDLYNWLNSDDEIQELGLISVNKAMNRKGCDISLSHVMIGEIPREHTNILIRDKNRKRTGNSSNTLIIDISQWPDTHVQDFEKYAKRLFLEQWDRLNQQKKVNQKIMRIDRPVAKRKKQKSRRQLLAEQLSVSTKTIDRLDAIRSLLTNTITPYRRKQVKIFKKEALVRFGEKFSTKRLRENFIKSQIASNLDYIDDLTQILQDAFITISINSDRRGSPGWFENWDKLLMSITPVDYALSNGDFLKIIDKYQSSGGLNFEQDVEVLHRMLILRDTPFFDFVAPEGGGKTRYSSEASSHNMCLTSPSGGTLFSYDRENDFFNELFKDL